MRVYLKASTSIGFSNISSVSNLVLGAGFNLHTWHKNNIVTAQRGSGRARAGVLLNSYFEVQVSPLLISERCADRNICTAKLVQPSQSVTMEFGMYAPIVPKWPTRPIRGVTNGFFLVPPAKGGVQYISSSAAQSATVVQSRTSRLECRSSIR